MVDEGGDRSDRRLVVVAATLAPVVLALALGATLPRLAGSENAEHAASHLSLGVPALLLLAAVRRVWPQPKPARLAHLARRLLTAGLALLAAGALLEAAGAFGYAGDVRARPGLAALHTAGLVAGAPAIPLAALGVVLGVAGRFEHIPRWARRSLFGLLAAGALVLLSRMIGVP